MSVPLQSLDETGQDRFETLATDPVGGLPQNDKAFPYGLAVRGRSMARVSGSS